MGLEDARGERTEKSPMLLSVLLPTFEDDESLQGASYWRDEVLAQKKQKRHSSDYKK